MKPRILWCGEFTELKTGYSVYGKEVLNRLNQTGQFAIHELACYAHQTDQRARKVPWSVYCNLPDPDNQDQQNQYNSNTANQFGAWRFEEVCLDCMAHCVCVPPGELVLTHNGYIPIEKLKVGDIVATHKGNFKPITKTFKRQYKGIIRSISFNGCKETLKLTPEHPVLIYKKLKQTNQKKSFKEIYDSIDPEFVAAKDVKAGDLIILPDFNQTQTQHYIDITNYLTQFIIEDGIVYTQTHYDTCNKLPQNITIDYDLGVILGYILGDGHVSKSSVIITLTGDEEHYANEYKELFVNKFNLNPSITKIKDKYAINVTVNSVLLSEFLQNFNYQKYIWDNKEFVKGLIRGLVRSDGCYKKNTVSFCSIHKNVAHLFRILCWLVEIPTCLHKNTNAYEVEGYGESARKLHEICKKHNNISTPDAKKPLKRVQHINNYLVASIMQNKPLDYHGQVYNIEVEKDNSYIIQQSCVHNCDIRDHWMMQYEFYSPFRQYYNHLIMPTVDSIPQSEEWIDDYKTADGVFTYQDWSNDVLNYEGAGKIKTLGEAPPSADPIFKPMNKKDIKKSIGLDQYKILGAVMRNQRRKLFPDLFEIFKNFIVQSGRQDVLLYCHTSYPDMGWDIPRLLLQYGLSSKVLFTYVCRKCGQAHPNFFSDALIHCPKCGELTAGMSNVQVGVDNQVLAAIYNMFDLYIQVSCAEGFGMPMVEAAACGVPVIGVDYSAMSDVVRKLGGFPVAPLKLATEMETGCYRAIPDNKKFVQLLIKLFELDDNKLEKLQQEARELYLHSYGWDKTAKKWYDYLTNIDIEYYEKRWNSQPNYHNVPNDYPKYLSNKDFARWLIINVLGEPQRMNSYMECRLIRDLNYNTSNITPGGMYFNEHSTLFGKPNWKYFDQQEAFKYFAYLGNKKNYWEKRRWEKIQQK